MKYQWMDRHCDCETVKETDERGYPYLVFRPCSLHEFAQEVVNLLNGILRGERRNVLTCEEIERLLDNYGLLEVIAGRGR